MSKIVQRLLTFFVGIPLVLLIVYVPFRQHIILHAALIIVATLSSVEIYHLLRLKSPMQPMVPVVLLSAVIPVIALVCALTGLTFELTTFAFIIAFMILLVLEIFVPAKSRENDTEIFADSNKRITGSLFVLLYGGYLLTFVSRMTRLPYATQYITVFLVMVFICDSFAWLFGMLFGTNNRGFVKASPNKSIAGFVGGICGSMLAGAAGWFCWPEIFTGSVVKMLVLGFTVAVTAILGDLAESVFKRSAQCKDSGNLIPGRGGILDSVDSILLTAPVFYLLSTVMFR
ncbi:phosphatidate cytidylyltransferase [Treponema brennaborense]|uniref:Phosphatidate cytidylyltransferase n=1 Tax=Treponema brennaborense (strain DSM 12168 / CIP 105900 / DD5/3) TaxID=906968 RepID=F4LN83_TREBD|nr:phosphatidate cytidylyltransferase [Treponema brennaborense]AEE16848.1 phosphatidate cytidylyltransferase [Treponema brennaborense DSM 12168]